MTFGQYAYESYMQNTQNYSGALWVELSPLEQQQWEAFGKEFANTVMKHCACDDCESQNVKIWSWV